MKLKQVLETKDIFDCHWFQVLEKKVALEGADPQNYYSLQQPDYVTIVAYTEDGFFPLLEQYRPAVERITLELPAGLVEKGETAAICAERELAEETGLKVKRLFSLGAYEPDNGRLCNRSHVFFAETSPSLPQFQGEPGLKVNYVRSAALKELIRRREMKHQIHLGALLACLLDPEVARVLGQAEGAW